MLKSKLLFVSIFIFAGFITICGCGKSSKSQEKSMPATLVSAAKAVKLDIPWDTEYPAQVAGSLEVEIRAQVGGILKERLYNEGQYVKKDSVLFVIDQEPYKVALERAQASLAQVNTEVQKSQRDYYRMKELIKDNAVSQKDYDDSLSAYEKSQADYKAAKAVVDDAQISLGYTKVKAPISGIARKENHSVGSLISTAGNESLLTTMVQINPLYVNFSMPSRQLAALKKEIEANRMSISKDLIIDILLDDQVYKEPGKIVFFDSAEDPKTAAIAVKVEVQNPKYERDLTPGQFVRVRLKGVTFKGAVIIPQSSLIESPTGKIVYVVNTSSNNVVEARPVESAIRDSLAIVFSGLEGDEVVVSAGSLKVRPGMSVNPDIQELVLPPAYQKAYNEQYAVQTSTNTVSSMDRIICQSCSMPMAESDYGTEADGSKNKDYCKYCYSNGKFLGDVTMEQMIEICLPHMISETITAEQARKMLEQTLPKLKRWNDGSATSVPADVNTSTSTDTSK